MRRAMSAQDPFYLVKEEIQDAVNKAQYNQRRWEQLPIGSGEREQLHSDLTTACDSVGWQLEELDRAIAVAERDPVRFNVDSAEILRRRAWTSSTRGQMTLLKQTLETAAAERPSGSKEGGRRELLRVPERAVMASSPRPDVGIIRDNEDFIAGEGDRQALLMRQQDDDLDDMSETLAKIGGMGLAIHDELSTQDKIITNLQSDTEATNTRLELVQRKMANVLKKAGVKGQLLMIIFLFVLLLVLIALVFYT